jgi:hypothetical protein
LVFRSEPGRSAPWRDLRRANHLDLRRYQPAPEERIAALLRGADARKSSVTGRERAPPEQRCVRAFQASFRFACLDLSNLLGDHCPDALEKRLEQAEWRGGVNRTG